MIVCKHGNRIDIELPPGTFGPGIYIMQTATMPLCQACLDEALADLVAEALPTDGQPVQDRKP